MKPDLGSGSVQTRALCSWLATVGVALAFLPSVAKRSVLIGMPDVFTWLAWDYGSRLASLAGVLFVYEAGAMSPAPPRAPIARSTGVFMAMLVVEYPMIGFASPWLQASLPYFQVLTLPIISDPHLLVFDLFAGVALVAIGEEFVFRRLLFSLLERAGFSKVGVLLLSSGAFGLVHITSGLGSAVAAFIYGLIFGVAFYATGRLSIPIALHFIDDFMVFGLRAFESGAFGPATSS